MKPRIKFLGDGGWACCYEPRPSVVGYGETPFAAWEAWRFVTWGILPANYPTIVDHVRRAWRRLPR